MAFHMCSSKQSDMVRLDDDGTKCTVYNIMPNQQQKKIHLIVRPAYTVQQIFDDVAVQFSYDHFDLILQTASNDESVFLNDKKDKILYEIPGFLQGNKNSLILMSEGSWENNPNKKVIDIEIELNNLQLSPVTSDQSSEDDLALGASASPTEPEAAIIIPTAPALPMFETSEAASTSFKMKLYSIPRPAFGYVGLVNQAMTCYLNSLLQALFMTPEFRNALYKWEFDGDQESKSIPYQLQKLFLNLQTSDKSAVETTDLTRSFGWDSTEAWQQHDIQELCRVMFDALEQKFKKTEQADLIARLYEGKMTDYVKCLECKTEKSREDTFLDIPLPVRPFGGTAAYNSIEEALRAFVQPEILEDNNQYFCEKCDKKCNAHKGLKFTKFPYVLTLHLKRFDFDYNTLHRIKLNDKVTFPQTLNLNMFVNATDVGTFNNHVQTNGFLNGNGNAQENEQLEAGLRYDDSSTTDSGAALEEDNCSGTATTASSSHNDNEMQEDDEGIDLGASGTAYNKNSGPFLYELFAIMIHSGSASGGHYYAYIKDFENDKWYCFNDQIVTSITQEDIQKSFGGGAFKTYYSGAYSTSTNAYMLMYRQIDPSRNSKAMKTDDFPPHIKSLVEHLGDVVETDGKSVSSTVDKDYIKPKVYYFDKKLKQFKEKKLYITRDISLEEALDTACTLLDVSVPLARCRLVAYSHLDEEIACSLQGREKEPVESILNSVSLDFNDFLLETREENEEFEIYKPGGITVKLFKIDLKTKDVEGPYIERVIEGGSVLNLRKSVAKKIGCKSKEITVAVYSICKDVQILKDKIVKVNGLTKFFCVVEKVPNEAIAENLKDVIREHFTQLICIFVSAPNTDTETLESLSIPPYEPKPDTPVKIIKSIKKILADRKQKAKQEGGDVVDAVMLNGGGPPPLISTQFEPNFSNAPADYKRLSPLPGSVGGCESNSEDSSLSDGDRTLVESTANPLSQSSSPRHSPLLSSPEYDVKLGCALPTDLLSDDEEPYKNLFFKAVPITDADYAPHLYQNANNSDTENEKDKKGKIFKVIVDRKIKLGSFKRALEPLISVSSEYFKLVRNSGTSRNEQKHEFLGESLVIFKDSDVVHIELGRCLKSGESKAKVYYLKLSELNNEISKLPLVCEWIFMLGLTIGEAKKELVAQLHKIDPKHSTLTPENCRIWEKSGKNFGKILQDDQRLGHEVYITNSCEFIVQECECDKCTPTDDETVTLFVRRWFPETLELGNFDEITLGKSDDIKKALSDLSGISENELQYGRAPISFPATCISILNINTICWYSVSATPETYSHLLSHGNVYFYSNTNETLKDLTNEERREIQKKEKSRLDRLGGSVTVSYSPRRERALKIYLDSPPKKRDE